MNFINVTEEMDALNIIGQKYDIKDMILFAIIYYNSNIRLDQVTNLNILNNYFFLIKSINKN